MAKAKEIKANKAFSGQNHGPENSRNKRTVFIFLVCCILGLSAFTGGGEKKKKSLREIGLRTVVIDPGHGGKDPGCQGVSSREKDVALAVGLRLGKYIEENYKDVKVIYTRKDDRFIELHERASIANRNNADLFICIHANSGASHAHGTETYVMGLHKSEANLKVAERENASVLMEENHEENYKDFDGSPAAIIALSIQQAAFLDQSVRFASKIQKQFTELGRRDRGVKQAGFLVLYKTTMPSVLIETGFLTNKEEEKFLADPASQEKMATGIFKAFEAYKKEIELVNNSVDGGTEISGNEGGGSTGVEKPESATPIEKTDENAATGIVFKVQIATSSTPIPRKASNFNGLNNVDEYISKGLYKYTVGRTATLDEAKKLQNELREKGFNGSFIVAFEADKRIRLQEAIERTKSP